MKETEIFIDCIYIFFLARLFINWDWYKNIFIEFQVRGVYMFAS